MGTVTGVCASCRKPGVGSGVILAQTRAIALHLLLSDRSSTTRLFNFFPIKSMQPTISIPGHWGYPRFAFDQRTEQGTILGLYYYPSGTELANEFDKGWRYVLMPNKNSDEISYLQENQIQPLTPEELFQQITAEIDFYQQQISILNRQLDAIARGANNA
ncbi:hypothetical protein LC609_19280 [Nostoc sp. XA013]|nr:hypothetical protein [Nostoc sp. XA013]